MFDETILCEVQAHRKGRSQAPCILRACFINDLAARQVVLRTEDVGGVPPLVAVLTPEAARELGQALVKAADMFSQLS